MLTGVRLAVTSLAIFVALTTASIAAPPDNERSCLFGSGAMNPPAIPKQIIYSQKYTLIRKGVATYSAILKNGFVLFSTHMECEHYGASVALAIPIDQNDENKGVGEQLKNLLNWYIGEKNAQEVLAKIKGQSLVGGWREDIPDASDEFPNMTISVQGMGETYVVIEVYYFSQ